jgi:hypothetical protein
MKVMMCMVLLLCKKTGATPENREKPPAWG